MNGRRPTQQDHTLKSIYFLKKSRALIPCVPHVQRMVGPTPLGHLLIGFDLVVRKLCYTFLFRFVMTGTSRCRRTSIRMRSNRYRHYSGGRAWSDPEYSEREPICWPYIYERCYIFLLSPLPIMERFSIYNVSSSSSNKTSLIRRFHAIVLFSRRDDNINNCK